MNVANGFIAVGILLLALVLLVGFSVAMEHDPGATLVVTMLIVLVIIAFLIGGTL